MVSETWPEPREKPQLWLPWGDWMEQPHGWKDSSPLPSPAFPFRESRNQAVRLWGLLL